MSNRKYTDKEMQYGAQIGYYNFSSIDLANWQDIHPNQFPTLREYLCEYMRTHPKEDVLNVYCHQVSDVALYTISEFKNYSDKSFNLNDYNALKKDIDDYKRMPLNSSQRDKALRDIVSKIDYYSSTFEDRFTLSLIFNMDFTNMTNIKDSFEPSSWRLMDVVDNNSSSGMYASAIYTSDGGDVLLCYRGSERETDSYQHFNSELVTDWIEADLGLALGDLTQQEIEASNFLKKIITDSSVKTVATTGHSLGGNLALMAAVIGVSAGTNNKFVQGCSFDGPSNPMDALNQYKNNISLLRDRLYHYTFSLVGAIYGYNNIAGNDKEILISKNPNNGFVSSHFLSYVQFDGNDMVVEDNSTKLFCELSRRITDAYDDSPSTEKSLNDGLLNPTIKTMEFCLALSQVKYHPFSFETYFNIHNTWDEMIDSYENAFSTFCTFTVPNTVQMVANFVNGMKNNRYQTINDILVDLTKLFVLNSYSYSNNNPGTHNSPNTPTNITGHSKGGNNSTQYFNSTNNWGLYGKQVSNWSYYNFSNYSNRNNQLEDKIVDILRNINFDFLTAMQSIRYNPDPLVIDLESNGISLTSKEEGVYFDEDSKGLKEKSQWINPEDALLAIDLNNNGIIDSGEELFGTSTILSDGSLARNGFEALTQYDSNSDGIIDLQDAIFENLLVWRDKNADGITDEGELESIIQHGIESISLTPIENAETDSAIRSAEIRYTDGHTAKVSEVDFEADYYDSKEKVLIDISEDIKILPNVKAIGNIPSLHTLMQKDESGELKTLVENFINAERIDERSEICEQILYRISYALDVEVGSRGNEFDAQKLAVIEAFMGRDFVGTAGRNPVNTAATILSSAYDSLFNMYYTLLTKEGLLNPYLSLLYVFESEEGEKYIDTSLFDVYAKQIIESEKNMLNIVPEMARFISVINPDNPHNVSDFVNVYANYEGYLEEFKKCGDLGITIASSGDDSLYGSGNNDIVSSGLGDDTVYGNDGDDTLYGNDGNDSLYGGNGNDTLVGGTGNDRLEGGYQDDTYIFNLGDGEDVIADYQYSSSESRADRIVFGEGINVEDVKLQRKGWDLEIKYSETDKITIQDAYWNNGIAGNYEVENVEFSNGIKTKVDYDSEGLEIIYKPESIGDISVETDDDIVEDVIIESEVDAMADAISMEISNSELFEDKEYGLDEYQSEGLIDDSSADINNMTNLMVQELSGEFEISSLYTDINVAGDSLKQDDLIWTE